MFLGFVFIIIIHIDWKESEAKDVDVTQSGFQKALKAVEGYMRNSTLHGLKYVGDSTISYGERFFWLIAFILAVSGAVYFISSIYIKYNINPVIVTMNPNPTSVDLIPFPAVTICNMNAAKKTEAEKILKEGSAADQNFLDNLCDSENSVAARNALDNETGSWKNVVNFMSRVGQHCERMLRMCKWHLTEMECDQLFNPVLTDEGLCCSFNQLPVENILRNPGYRNTLNSSKMNLDKFHVDDWNPERGYAEDAPHDAFPFRSPGPGAHLGLSLVLDTNINNYYCSSSSSAGFKVLLHNPAEIPKMSDFAFMLPPGNEIRVVFKPIINDATHTLKQIDIAKRHCYFTEERYLRYYRTYSKVNCKMECLTNVTLERCGCVPYYLPNSASTKVCSKLQEDCSDNVREMMELKQMASDEEKKCNCLPGCFQLDYEKSMSYGKIIDTFKVKAEMLQNESMEYFHKNMLVVHIYFVNTQFSKFTKSELYGFSEFLSNTGGILGLFLGFSALSLIEILYYLTLRIVCISLRNRRKRNNMKKPILVK